MSHCWYVIRSHPLKENALWQQLLLLGLEVYYPRLKVNPVNPRARRVIPYFPGYLFVNLNLAEGDGHRIQFIPHASGLVGFGGEPAEIPESLIQGLRKRIGNIFDQQVVPLDRLEKGEKVVIEEGVFAGYEALFDSQVPGTERVRLLIEMITGRRVPLIVDSSSIWWHPRKKTGKFNN